jgi:hypothetical protein
VQLDLLVQLVQLDLLVQLVQLAYKGRLVLTEMMEMMEQMVLRGHRVQEDR